MNSKTMSTNVKAPKYLAVLILKTVICQNCKTQVQPSQIELLLSPDMLCFAGEALHKQAVESKRILCATPDLLIVFENAFALTDSIKKMAQTVLPANGKIQ